MHRERQITEAVLADMERVRKTGVVNMLDRRGVHRLAVRLDCDALATYLGACGRDGYVPLLSAFAAYRRLLVGPGEEGG